MTRNTIKKLHWSASAQANRDPYSTFVNLFFNEPKQIPDSLAIAFLSIDPGRLKKVSVRSQDYEMFNDDTTGFIYKIFSRTNESDTKTIMAIYKGKRLVDEVEIGYTYEIASGKKIADMNFKPSTQLCLPTLFQNKMKMEKKMFGK